MLAALHPQPPSTPYQFADNSLATCPPCREVTPFLTATLRDCDSRFSCASLPSVPRLSPPVNDTKQKSNDFSNHSLDGFKASKARRLIAEIEFLFTAVAVKSKGEKGSVEPSERIPFALSKNALGSANFLDLSEEQLQISTSLDEVIKFVNGVRSTVSVKATSSASRINTVGVAKTSSTWTKTGSEQNSTTVNNNCFYPESSDSLIDAPQSPLLQQVHPVTDRNPLSSRRTSTSSVDSTSSYASLQPARKRPKVVASKGDAVLISFLAPEQHDIARNAGLDPLPYPSEGESTEPEMEGGSGSGSGGGAEGDGTSGRDATRRQSEDETKDDGGTSSSREGNGGAQKGGSGGNGHTSGNSGGSGDDDDDQSKKPNPDPMPDEITEEENPKKRVKNNDQEDREENQEVDTTTQVVGDNKYSPEAMEIDISKSSETAESLMSLAEGALGEHNKQAYHHTASLPVFPPNGGEWGNSQSHDGSTTANSGFPPSPEDSTKNFSNKLSPPLPSILQHGASQDGKPTLPPLNSIHGSNSIDVLAELATKESPQQQQANWNGSRRTSESRTVVPTVHAHLNLAASNRPQPPQSPGLPTPGYAPEGSPRPPIHHMSAQHRQIYMHSDPSYFHKNSHYTSPYPPIKDPGSNSPGNGAPYASNYQTNRELPNLVQPSPPPNHANFFAQTQQTLPASLGGPAISGRRESTSSEFQYTSDHATPSGPATGETMPSTGSDDTITSPTNRPSMAAGSQSGSLTGGGFKCEHPGCKAPPFQTQYLLNSHANVHSSNRPHYCPVKGCPRAEGGKGFKRKNEMIRHGLVHDSPGYVCPFCPDREHKYPRPDNLQRHVRVHHMDKDKDDPQLRDVLSQRPEGGSRGRRRRIGTSS